jgi:RNA polymerase sigma-70 factor, ECF subfamily
MIDDGTLFEDARPNLIRHAYRMTGSMSDAEDIVQDAYLRWRTADHVRVRDPRAYLRATVTHLALDRLRAQTRARETYVGPWLPEPFVSDETAIPEAVVSIAEDVSIAFLLALERLSPLERAAFLLHDALDVPFSEIANMLGRTEEAVRRLASRARNEIRQDHHRRIAPPQDAQRVRDRLLDALRRDDVAALTELLTEDVMLVSDGGGKKPAATQPIAGRDNVASFLAGVARKGWELIREMRGVAINGLPGWLMFTADGLEQTLAVEVNPAGHISAIYVTRNPDKLMRASGSG